MTRVIPHAVKCPTCDYYNELCSHVAARIEKLEQVMAGAKALIELTKPDGAMADRAVNEYLKELIK